MTSATPARIRCRQISQADIPALVDLLTVGFPQRSQTYWSNALTALAQRKAPENYPRFGYLLQLEDRVVGVFLMIFSSVEQSDGTHTRCNISSWYVDPQYQGYASLLIAAAVRHKNVTYINISPATHTWPVIEAQGFSRYCSGQMATFPLLAPRVLSAYAEVFDPSKDYGDTLSAAEVELLRTHADYGCRAYVVMDRGRAAGTILRVRRCQRTHRRASRRIFPASEPQILQGARTPAPWRPFLH